MFVLPLVMQLLLRKLADCEIYAAPGVSAILPAAY